MNFSEEPRKDIAGEWVKEYRKRYGSGVISQPSLAEMIVREASRKWAELSGRTNLSPHERKIFTAANDVVRDLELPDELIRELAADREDLDRSQFKIYFSRARDRIAGWEINRFGPKPGWLEILAAMWAEKHGEPPTTDRAEGLMPNWGEVPRQVDLAELERGTPLVEWKALGPKASWADIPMILVRVRTPQLAPRLVEGEFVAFARFGVVIEKHLALVGIGNQTLTLGVVLSSDGGRTLEDVTTGVSYPLGKGIKVYGYAVRREFSASEELEESPFHFDPKA